jgi:hypothetical protein
MQKKSLSLKTSTFRDSTSFLDCRPAVAICLIGWKVWAHPFETFQDKISDLKHYANAKCGFLSQTTKQLNLCQQKQYGLLLTI